LFSWIFQLGFLSLTQKSRNL